MRHVFILNPAAGKSKQALALKDQIIAYFQAHPEKEYRLCITDGKGAATAFAEEECTQGGDIRFYACGGDGTLQEVAAGIPFGSSNVELAVLPCGSGNDFVRVFGGKENFSNLEEIIEGVAVSVDAIDSDKATSKNTWRSLNIASIGLDAAVGYKMQRYKKWPGVSGSMAYNLAVVDTICHPIGNKMQIEITGADGNVIKREGKFLMAVAANGRCYGGGYCGAPRASVNDGLLDFVLVKKISRFQISKVLSKYKAGLHDGVDCIEHISGTSIKVATEKEVICNVDGECFKADRISFWVVPGAFRLVLPTSVAEEFGFLSKGELAKV